MAEYLSFALDRIATKTLPCHWIATPDGDLAILTVLALDGGKRARLALVSVKE